MVYFSLQQSPARLCMGCGTQSQHKCKTTAPGELLAAKTLQTGHPASQGQETEISLNIRVCLCMLISLSFLNLPKWQNWKPGGILWAFFGLLLRCSLSVRPASKENHVGLCFSFPLHLQLLLASFTLSFPFHTYTSRQGGWN